MGSDCIPIWIKSWRTSQSGCTERHIRARFAPELIRFALRFDGWRLATRRKKKINQMKQLHRINSAIIRPITIQRKPWNQKSTTATQEEASSVGNDRGRGLTAASRPPAGSLPVSSGPPPCRLRAASRPSPSRLRAASRRSPGGLRAVSGAPRSGRWTGGGGNSAFRFVISRCCSSLVFWFDARLMTASYSNFTSNSETGGKLEPNNKLGPPHQSNANWVGGWPSF